MQVNSALELIEQAAVALVKAKNDGHDLLEWQTDLAKVVDVLNYMQNFAKTRPELRDVVKVISKGKEEVKSLFQAHGIES